MDRQNSKNGEEKYSILYKLLQEQHYRIDLNNKYLIGKNSIVKIRTIFLMITDQVITVMKFFKTLPKSIKKKPN